MSNISNNIRLSGIIKESIVDGPGFRYVIFTQGCKKRCYMCHNSETQPLDKGYLKDMDEIVNQWRKNPLLKGITLSGGEPFLQPKEILYLVKRAKETNLDILIYSGYYYEELMKFNVDEINEVLMIADYLIDGPFDYNKKDLNILFRGSTNQRIIDLKATNINNTLTFIDKF